MTPGVRVDHEEAALVEAARLGDEEAFSRLVEEHRSPVHAHCYRLLGSLQDAEDAAQETFVRAWRAVARYEPRGAFRSWLYAIATNVCLRAMERRQRTPDVLDPDEAEIASYLQPFPDRLLPTDATVEERESLGLAFVSVMQLLPARQRAVLVLRDVLGWSAAETADLLGDSVASVNSALQRARGRLAGERAAGRLAREHQPASGEEERAVMRRFVEAWESLDVDELVALLTADAVLTMPPEPMRVVGAEAIGDFFRTVPAGGALERIRLLPARANGQPALAAYLDGEAYGVMVFALEGSSVASITGFAGYPNLPPALGLPARVET